MVPFALMFAVVVVVGVIVDFVVVVVNDDDISVIVFRKTSITIPCRTVYNATLPHPSNYIPPVPLNLTNSILINHFRSITPITLCHIRFTLLHPSHITFHILLYPVHLTLPRPKYTNVKKKKNTLVNYINSIFNYIGTIQVVMMVLVLSLLINT